MRKAFRIFVWGVFFLAAGVAIVGVGVWIALRHVPSGYRRLAAADPAEAQKASDEMVRRSLALRNALATQGKWRACFSAEHLNGWFAVDMVQNHPELLPAGWSSPRIQITPGGIVAYGRFQRGMVDCVVSLYCEVSLVERNLLAVRIHRVRAGALPMPLKEVIDRITQAAVQRQVPLQWRQSGGDPVALIPLDFRHPETRRQVQVESLRIQEDMICLAGSTQ